MYGDVTFVTVIAVVPRTDTAMGSVYHSLMELTT